MGKQRFSYSLRKILAVMLAILVPVAVGGIFLILYSVRDMESQQRAALQASVEAQAFQADTELERMNSYIIDLLLNDLYVEQLRQAETVNARNVAARKLISQFEYDDVVWDTVCSYAFFVPSRNLVFSRYNDMFPYEDNLDLRSRFQELIGSGTLEFPGLPWRSVLVGETPYLYQVYHVEGVYLAAWVSCDALFSEIKTNSLSPKGEISYLLPGTDAGLPEQVTDAVFRMEFSPSYMDIELLVTDEPYLEWGSFSLIVCFLIFILLVVLSVTVYTLCYYHRHIQQPLESFIRHVDEYAARRQTARRAGFQELNDAVEAFDGLSRQIEKLRIDLYEEKLAVAQTEMEYYQLQIKPHFFVNCFSLIHAMAQKQEYQRIQSFCIKLSNYVRYLFSKSLSLVPLKQELSMVQEFLDIQRIRHRVDSQLEEAVDGEAEKLCIPPLSLLTFVENAVKHGGVKSIVIQIKVELIRQNGGKRLRLSVQDTGVGFPPEILEAANSSHLGQDKGHLGICNIQKRLQLLYGENYRLSFSNNELGGLVELEFPAGDSVKMSGFE